MSPPRVSVILPFFNAAATLARAIESIQSQTLHDWELLLYNDGATDASPQIAESYAAQDPRIRILGGTHLGITAALAASMRAGFGAGGGEGGGEGVGGCEARVFHSADSNGDFVVSLSELLRVIQFYNARGYRCDPASEDGYSVDTGGGDQSCPPHASDYLDGNRRVNLSELLRLIQLYNVGGYEACDTGGEDPYCGTTNHL